MFQEANLRVYLISGGSGYQVDTYNVTDQPYAILSDLDRNRDYEVIVNGTLGRGQSQKAMVTTPVPFSLDGRGIALSVLFWGGGAGHVHVYFICDLKISQCVQQTRPSNHWNCLLLSTCLILECFNSWNARCSKNLIIVEKAHSNNQTANKITIKHFLLYFSEQFLINQWSHVAGVWIERLCNPRVVQHTTPVRACGTVRQREKCAKHRQLPQNRGVHLLRGPVFRGRSVTF